MDFQIDYLRYTIIGDINPREWILEYYEKFGSFEVLDYGGMGYKSILQSEGGLIKVYYDSPDQQKRFTVDIKGKGCSCLDIGDYCNLVYIKNAGVDVRINRLDLAWNNIDITPLELWETLMNDKDIITHSRRSSFRLINTPYKLQEMGDKGCQTVYLGSRSSGRMIRVYNAHGYTRLEFELKAEWAQLVYFELIDARKRSLLVNKAAYYLDNYLRIKQEWWLAITSSKEEGQKIARTPKTVSIYTKVKWIMKQVAPSLYQVKSGLGEDYTEFMKGVESRGKYHCKNKKVLV